MIQEESNEQKRRINKMKDGMGEFSKGWKNGPIDE